MNDLLKIVTLLGTLVALVATSRTSVCDTSAPEPGRYHVTGTCGPEGDVAITADTTCTLGLDGGAAVLLPPYGQYQGQTPLVTSSEVFLSGLVEVPTGTTVRRSDGGVFAEGLVRSCTGSADGGTTIELSCRSYSADVDGEESCSLTLTPTN